MTLDEWREALADALAPLVPGATPDQIWLAKYQAGCVLLQMQEHLSTEDRVTLLLDRDFTPESERQYIAVFLGQAHEYVKQQRREP